MSWASYHMTMLGTLPPVIYCIVELWRSTKQIIWDLKPLHRWSILQGQASRMVILPVLPWVSICLTLLYRTTWDDP